MQAPRKALITMTCKDDDGTVKPPEKGNTLTEKQKITLINNIQEILIFGVVINGDRGHTEVLASKDIRKCRKIGIRFSKIMASLPNR